MNEIEQLKQERDAATARLEQVIKVSMVIGEMADELGLKLGDRYSIEGVTALVSAYKAAKDKIAKITGQYEALLYTLADLARTEWSPRFERLMRNRLIMGALRYGRLNARGKRQYDRVASIIKRLGLYKQTGNKEHLVDCVNLCLMEFEECHHPLAHFEAADDQHHTKAK